MKSLFSKFRILFVPAIVLTGFMACGVGDTGRLSLSLTDKPSDLYNSVFVTIKEIAVHAADDPEGTWTVIAEPNRTIDLLTLKAGVREQLALVSLTSGHYSQMRLMIGGDAIAPHLYANYVIDDKGISHEMKIPSGFQTGVKLVQGFDINEKGTTELTLDFDASRSVVVAGNSEKYLLKPTIQVVDTARAVVIGGTVSKKADATPLEGALVSVQVYNPDTLIDPKDQITVKTSTFSDDTGAYKFFFAVPAEGLTLNLVAALDGYVHSSAKHTVMNDDAVTQDFPLEDVAVNGSGTVDIDITNAVTDEPVTLSIRQAVAADSTVIEVKSISIVNPGADVPANFALPIGDYVVVASTKDKGTKSVNFTVLKDQTVAVAVIF